MTSKYSLAKNVLAQVAAKADSAGIELADAYGALLVSLVDVIKEEKIGIDLSGLLQVELDNLGRGGVYELPRGGGHS